jgi:hypothetical protein
MPSSALVSMSASTDPITQLRLQTYCLRCDRMTPLFRFDQARLISSQTIWCRHTGPFIPAVLDPTRESKFNPPEKIKGCPTRQSSFRNYLTHGTSWDMQVLLHYKSGIYIKTVSAFSLIILTIAKKPVVIFDTARS